MTGPNPSDRRPDQKWGERLPAGRVTVTVDSITVVASSQIWALLDGEWDFDRDASIPLTGCVRRSSAQ